jgi:hypothetical protein
MLNLFQHLGRLGKSFVVTNEVLKQVQDDEATGFTASDTCLGGFVSSCEQNPFVLSLSKYGFARSMVLRQAQDQR